MGITRPEDNQTTDNITQIVIVISPLVVIIGLGIVCFL